MLRLGVELPGEPDERRGAFEGTAPPQSAACSASVSNVSKQGRQPVPDARAHVSHPIRRSS